MRYEIDNKGYIVNVYFGCYGEKCIEYNGEIPEGYDTLPLWAENENINAWKIVDDNLVYDANRAAEIERQCEYETNRNTPATQGYVNDKLNQSNEILIDELSNNAEGTQLIELKDSGDYEINSLKIPLSNEMYLKYKGAIEQETREGYNLIDISKLEQGGMSGAGDYGNDYSGSTRVRTEYIPVTPNTTYLVQAFDTNILVKYLFEYDQNKTGNKETRPYIAIDTVKKIFTTSSDTYYIRVAFSKSDDTAIIPSNVTKVQMVLGTVEKPYEQYGAKPSPENESPIKTITGECSLYRYNKNIYNNSHRNNQGNIYATGGTATEENGTFTLIPSVADARIWEMIATGSTYNENVCGPLMKIEKDKKLIINLSNSWFNKNFITFYDIDKKMLSYKSFTSGTTIDILKNAEYFTLRFGNGNAEIGVAQSTTIEVKFFETFPLSLGSLELCEDDYIHNVNGKWYKCNEWGKNRITFRGKHPSIVTDTKSFFMFELPNKNKSGISGATDLIYCDYLKARESHAQASFNNNDDGIWWENYSNYCYAILPFTTVNDANDWANSVNLTAIYKLDTPIEEEITDTTLLAQLDTITRELKLDKEVVHFYLQSENGVRVDVPMYYEDGLQLKVTNKNLIKNNAVSQTLDGVEITVNEDKTINLNGTATADIELVLNGTDTNTDMLFLIKSNIGYYQNGLIDGVSIGLYNYDGTDRTELSNMSNGQLNLSDDGVVTEVILKIANGTTFSNAKIYPMLTISDDPEQYAEAQENSLIKMDLSSFIFNTDDYIEIKDDNVSLVSGDNSEHLQCLDAPLKTFSPETYVMLNKFNDMSINYFRNKYLAERINKIESDIDGIRMEVSESFKATETVTGHKIVRMENAFAPANIQELRITGEMSLIFPSENLFPSETLFPLDSYLIVDKSETLSEDAQKIHLPLYYLHYMDENVHDEFIVTADECKFIKRVGKNADGSYYALTEPIEKTYEGVEIPQFEDVFYMYLENFRDADLTYRVIYEIKNYVNDNYASKAVLQLLSNAILAEVAKKIGNDEVIARINMAILGIEDAEIPEDINKSIIEILANKISIKSDNFELTKEGVIKSIAGEIGGWIINETNLEKTADQTIIYSRQDTQNIDVLVGSEEIGWWDDLCYPSADDYRKFDFDADGNITDSDRDRYASLYGGFDKRLTTTGTVKFNSNDIFNTLVFENETMDSKTGIGTLGVTTNLLEANVGFVKKLFCTEGLILPIADRLIKAFPVLSRSNDHVHQFDIESYNNLNALVLYSDNTFYGRYLPVSENHRNIETPASNGTITILTDKGTYLELQTGANTYMINYVTSDEKLKENIEKTEIESALSLIKQINLYSFDWLVNGKHEKIGFIANELYELDAILADKIEQPNGEYLYQYNDKTILALQTKAIQELNEKVEKQQKMIDFLINKLDCKEELENFMKGEN